MFGEFIERWEVMLLRVELVFWLLKLRGEKNEIRVEWVSFSSLRELEILQTAIGSASLLSRKIRDLCDDERVIHDKQAEISFKSLFLFS